MLDEILGATNSILLIPLVALVIALLFSSKKKKKFPQNTSIWRNLSKKKEFSKKKSIMTWPQPPMMTGPHRCSDSGLLHITEPAFWLDSNGNTPEAFTQITLEDVASGKYRPANPDLHDIVMSTACWLQKLQEQGK